MQEIKTRFSKFAEAITSERFFFFYIIFVMISLPVTEIYDELHSHSFVSQPIIVEIAGYFGIFAFILHFLNHKNIKYYLSDLLFFLLFVFAVLSAAFTQNRQETFHGFYNDEWLFDFVGYFSLMLAATVVKDNGMRKSILKAFVFVAFLQVSAAALQTAGIFNMECYFDTDFIMQERRSYGLTQHSNWYGGLSVLLFACLSGIYLYTRSKVTRNIMFIMSMVCFYTLLCAEARLAWVGTVAYLFFLAVSFIVMKRRGFDKDKMKSILQRFAVLLFGMAAVFAFVLLSSEHITKKIERTSYELSEGKKTEMASYRGYIWKYALEAVPEHWAFGIGLDNFRDVFYSNPNFDSFYTNGKGHNEYIHYLATQGVFQLITYLTLLVYAAVTGIRTVIRTEDKEERFISWICLGMLFGYAAQAFFNSSVVNIAPYFWITVGMCLTQKNQRYFGYSKEHKITKV